MPAKKSAARRGRDVTTVTVSPKFQILIPPVIREALRIRPGQRFQAFQYQGRIELIPVIPIRKARGMFKGIDATVQREERSPMEYRFNSEEVDIYRRGDEVVVREKRRGLGRAFELLASLPKGFSEGGRVDPPPQKRGRL